VTSSPSSRDGMIARHGGVPEWPIGTALKAVAGSDVSRGFESRPLCRESVMDEVVDAVVDGQSVYLISRAHTVAVLGRFATAAGIFVVAATLVAALVDGLPDPLAGVLLVSIAVAVALTGIAALRVLRPAVLLRLDDTGYRVHGLRGAGPRSATWTEVARVRRERLVPGSCIVLTLAGGARTVVPLRLLDGGGTAADRLVADLSARLDAAHGQRRLR
jgi:hypothetical protein